MFGVYYRWSPWLWVVVAVFGCGDDVRDFRTCLPTCGDGPTYVIRDLTFVIADDNHVAAGFDLDDRISTVDDRKGCYTPDLTAPDSTPGIDNQLAFVLGELSTDVPAAVDAAFEQAITTGGFLITYEAVDQAGPGADGKSAIVFRRGTGQPQLNADNQIAPDQTIRLHPDSYMGALAEFRSKAGQGRGGPFQLDVRFDYEGRALAFSLAGAHFESEHQTDGRVTGIFGGGVGIQDAVNLVVGLLNDEGRRDLVAAVVAALSDLYNADTGECDRMSLTVAFEAVPATLTGP